MLIDPQLLVSAGSTFRKYEKGQFIFFEGNPSMHYFQIISGQVSIVNVKPDGSEFIQGIFKEGEGFGMAAVLIEEAFPSTAIAFTDVVLLRLERLRFMEMLKSNSEVLMNVTKALCRKLYQKAFLGKGMATNSPEDRIVALLDVLKKESGTPDDARYKLILSRQQVADMIGLRVETVIRAIKKLEEKNALEIKSGKVFY